MRSRFITSSANASTFPKTNLAEFAFVGRSNVGKSSLLNGVAASRIARTSRTPGRTQLINFFEVHGKNTTFMLADLPGYGWAKAPASVRASWRKLMDRYVEEREPLRALLLLLDSRRGAEEEDVELFRSISAIIAERGAEVQIVATKCDKLSKSELKPALQAIARALAIDPNTIFATSAEKNMGIEELRKWIARTAKSKAVSNKPGHRSSVASDGC